MDTAAALRGMKAQAGLCIDVVGDLRAAVQLHRRVGIARGGHRDTARLKQRTQPRIHGKSDGLFRLIVGEASAQIVATVGRIEHDDKPGGRRGRRGSSRGGRSLRASQLC